MNQRVTQIASHLVKASGPVRIVNLAEQFKVSQRTIRNDLNEINDLLSQQHLERLTLKSGGLIVLPEGFAEIMPLLSSGDLYAYKLSREERKQAAAALLTAAPGYITLSSIADSLFVSRATLINDLELIKVFVNEDGLEVRSYPNKGMRVLGPESVKRLFLLKLTADRQSVVASRVSVLAGNRVILQKILGEQEQCHGCRMTDDSFRTVLTYLGIMVSRNMQGNYVEDQPDAGGDKYVMAQDVLKYVSQYCSVSTTENEIRMLAGLLERSRYISQQAGMKNAVKIQALTRHFISGISQELDINLNGDYDFFENLSNHLESVFSAPPVDYPGHELIEEVLEDNQDVVEAVHARLPLIQSFASRPITEMEISYIAIHVCAAIERKKNREVAFRIVVACHAGIGTSQLLLEKLKEHFNFQIVDVISAHEAKNLKEGDADFVISTVPLTGCVLEYIVVSPSLSDEEYVRVGNKIDALRSSRRLPSRVDTQKPCAKGMIEKLRPVVYEMVPEQAPELMKQLRKVVRDYFNQSVEAEAEIFSPYLHHLLPAENIELDVECSDWRDAVRRSALPLMERGYIEERYIDAMIANIEQNGPYIVLSKGFAVPHEGLEQGSIRVGMHLIRLKTPVSFGAEELDPVEFVCCLSAVDHKTHLKAFFNLVNMLRDDSFKRLLHESTTPAEAASVIEKYEYSHMS